MMTDVYAWYPGRHDGRDVLRMCDQTKLGYMGEYRPRNSATTVPILCFLACILSSARAVPRPDQLGD